MAKAIKHIFLTARCTCTYQITTAISSCRSQKSVILSFLSIDVAKIILFSFNIRERRIYFSINIMTFKYSFELQSFMKSNKQNRISFKK